MPAIWSSSERPISVRTVWVDGVRHAILTPDDPLLNIKNHRRPQTATKQRSYPIKYVCRESFRSPESLDSCFVNLHVVIDNKKDSSNESGKVLRRQSAPINRLQSSRQSLNLELNGILKPSKNNNSFDDTKNQSDRSLISQKFTPVSRDNSIDQSDLKCSDSVDDDLCKVGVTFSDDFEENLHVQEINSNPLSERVLQWMDMSGRVSDYTEKLENHINMGNRRLSQTKAKVCSFRRQYLTAPHREIIATQQFKLTPVKKPLECDFNETNNQNYLDERKKSAQKLFKNEVKSEIIAENNKSIWSPLSKPQLHIFMPDLNSSDEDTSSQDSSTLEEALSHSD